MKYLAVIGDVVDSKRLPRRGEFQSRLAESLKRVSSRNPALASPYTLTLGDEFQAVYRTADRLFADIFAIWRDVHPAEVRFAVGLGKLDTAINPKQALGMDGPAFHHARDAVTAAKEAGYRVRFGGDDSSPPAGFDQWNLLNRLFNLVTHEVRTWERNRLHIMQGLLAGKSVADLEGELEISRVAIYKNINTAVLGEVRELCLEVAGLLNHTLKAE